jgi:hypothetical protein
MEVWEVTTESFSLQCSKNHFIQTKHGWCQPLYRLKVGDKVKTQAGIEEITSIKNLNETRELYDITVDDPSGLFYSDGISSHNSTTLIAR